MYNPMIMEVLKRIRCKTAESAGKIAKKTVKFGNGMGKSFPGYLFLKIGSHSCLPELAKKPKIGTIIITGTNGKTTSTKLISMLLEKNARVSYNYDSNTLNAITTGLLCDNIDLGVFEYGIRDVKNAFPDTVSRLIKPVGVVYTNISREHSFVGGRKNPFEEYLKAKKLLSAPMEKGIVICNADDPRTTYIGKSKETDEYNVHVTYYGLDIDLEDKSPVNDDFSCPMCREKMVYSKQYMNHKGIYKCKCGFERPKPDIELTDIVKKPDEWTVRIKGDTYNYSVNKNVKLDFNVKVPAFGVHNLYNLVCAVTTYASFTPTPEKIEKTVVDVCKNIDISILPPGRFEIFEIGDKLVGMGQGDNGDALKANVQFMEDYVNGELAFIYTTPDEAEDEIFEDHLNSLISANPKKVYVVPGRESVPAAQKYYDVIKESFDAEFYPMSHEEMGKRLDKIIELITESPYKYVIVSGCGPEHYMWAELKSRCKSLK